MVMTTKGSGKPSAEIISSGDKTRAEGGLDSKSAGQASILRVPQKASKPGSKPGGGK